MGEWRLYYFGTDAKYVQSGTDVKQLQKTHCRVASPLSHSLLVSLPISAASNNHARTSGFGPSISSFASLQSRSKPSGPITSASSVSAYVVNSVAAWEDADCAGAWGWEVGDVGTRELDFLVIRE